MHATIRARRAADVDQLMSALSSDSQTLWQLGGSAGPDHIREWQAHRLNELELAVGTVVSQLRLAVAVAEAKELSGVQRIFRQSGDCYRVRPDEAGRDFQRGSSS
jgi:hypothetical protein